MKKALRIVQVGVGGWGYSWAGIVQESPCWEIAAFVDTVPAHLEKAANDYDVGPEHCFHDLKRALDRVDCDAVLVVVPPETHKSISIMALEHGKHVLVEKPLADTIPSAQEIVGKAQEKNKNIMVSQNYRFKRGPRTVKNILNRKIVGSLGHISVNFHKSPDFGSSFRTEMEEPLLRDMSIHHFDQMRYLVESEPVEVYAQTWNPSWSWFKGNPVAVVMIEFSGGLRGHYHGSWVSQGWQTTWDGDWHIQCDQGEIHWADNEVIITPGSIFQSVFNPGMVEKEGRMIADLLPMELEDRHYSLWEFFRSIVENRDPETSGSDNLASMALTFAAVESARSGKAIRVDKMYSVHF